MINRVIWSFAFTENTKDTPWPCPTCDAGHLMLADGSLTFVADAATAAARSEIWWEPPMEKGRFTVAAKCSREDCTEGVAVSGVTEVIELPDEDHVREQFERLYRITYMDPPPRLVRLSEEVPESVQELVRSTCRLVWIDPSAAGNRGRAAVEQLLNELKVPRRRRTSKGKYRRLDLAERIGKFEEDHAELAGHLTAIRWVGNVGSHTRDMTSEVLLDGLDVLWYVLDELFLLRRGKIARAAKRLTKRKGRP